jgi:hypothetical protein
MQLSTERPKRSSLQEPKPGKSAGRAQIQEKIPSMAAVNNMPDVTREKMTVGTRHRLSLRASVLTPKTCG